MHAVLTSPPAPNTERHPKEVFGMLAPHPTKLEARLLSRIGMYGPLGQRYLDDPEPEYMADCHGFLGIPPSVIDAENVDARRSAHAGSGSVPSKSRDA